MRYRSEHRLFFPWTIICCMFKSRQTWQSIYMHRQWDSQECLWYRVFVCMFLFFNFHQSLLVVAHYFVVIIFCKKSSVFGLKKGRHESMQRGLFVHFYLSDIKQFRPQAQLFSLKFVRFNLWLCVNLCRLWIFLCVCLFICFLWGCFISS